MSIKKKKTIRRMLCKGRVSFVSSNHSINFFMGFRRTDGHITLRDALSDERPILPEEVVDLVVMGA